jgi:ankyrin repeat protein
MKVQYTEKPCQIPQINATDDQGRAPLHEASLNGHLDLVEYLINKNALVDNQDKNLETPLLFAARCGYLKVAEILIKTIGKIYCCIMI